MWDPLYNVIIIICGKAMNLNFSAIPKSNVFLCKALALVNQSICSYDMDPPHSHWSQPLATNGGSACVPTLLKVARLANSCPAKACSVLKMPRL